MADADPSTPAAELVVFWRPGCPFCNQLLHGIARAGLEAELRNIWEDPDAAATVRSVARGYETVPTVFVRGRPMVNPPLCELLAALEDESAA